MKGFLQKLAEAGWTPHAGQEAYLRAKARFRVLACGRRWGKTDAAAAELAGRIATTPQSRQLAIAPTVAQARIVFERVLWMLGAAGVACVPALTPFPSIRTIDGEAKGLHALHVLDARSGHQARYLRGQGADHILMDEAAYLPEALIAETAMPMLATTGGSMTMISTPNGRNHFYRYFLNGQNGEREFWSHTGASSENPLVDRDYLRLQEGILTDRAFRTEYLAEFTDSDSAVFESEFIQAALSAPVVEHGSVIIGADWGRHEDNTAVIAVRGTRERAQVIAAEAWTGIPWKSSALKAAEFARTHGARVIVCDSTGSGDPVREQLHEIARDIFVKKFVFTRQSKHAAVTVLLWMLQNGRLRLPPDVDLIGELQSFESTSTESIPKYGAGYGHDDRVCALAMACHELRAAEGTSLRGNERK